MSQVIPDILVTLDSLSQTQIHFCTLITERRLGVHNFTTHYSHPWDAVIKKKTMNNRNIDFIQNLLGAPFLEIVYRLTVSIPRCPD